VCHDDQEHVTPPQVMDTMKDTVEAVKITAPSQSKRLTLFNNLLGILSSLSNIMMATAPRPRIGMLIQKIQRQEIFWAKAPPINGPDIDPMAQIERK
jgi:hypothetical protein